MDGLSRSISISNVGLFAFAVATGSFLAGPVYSDDETSVCGPQSGMPKFDYVQPAASSDRSAAQAVDTAGNASGVTFTIEYLDVTAANGIGFDDPVSGTTRRATAVAVFDYIANALPHVGSADIQFQVSQTDGTGFLGQAQPLGNPFLIECQVLYPILHINSGIDPDPASPDGIITLDFGYTFNSDLGPPAVLEFDLFSLILHEATHAIGFVSTLGTDSDGNGPFGQNPDIRVTGFDDFIENSAGSAMVSCPTGTFIGTGGAGGDLVGPPSLRHAGPQSTIAWQNLGNTGSPPLYTPNPHVAGSSATHWDTNDAAMPADTVMIHVITRGVEKRAWSTLEFAALDDGGYSLGAQVPALGSGGLVLLVFVVLGVIALRSMRRVPVEGRVSAGH